MAGPQLVPWSDNPNSPQIPYSLYRGEKFDLAGSFITSVFYGIVVILFFQCITALFAPAGRGIKWILVAHTTAMFSFVTIYTATNLNIQSAAYIDNRQVPGAGPTGYQRLVYTDTVDVVSIVMFVLNAWLADGLLLYRCYVIYSTNRWIVALPCLMYLASVAMGVTFIYQFTRPLGITWAVTALNEFGIPAFSISIALNIFLTLMIVARIVLVNRDIRNVMNAPVKVGGLYKAIVTSLVESCALYSVTCLLYIASWAVTSPVSIVFLQVLVQIQTIAPFLITLRVANRSAWTNVTIPSVNASAIHFSSREKPGSGNGAVLDERSREADWETAVELGVGIETKIDLCHDERLKGHC